MKSESITGQWKPNTGNKYFAAKYTALTLDLSHNCNIHSNNFKRISITSHILIQSQTNVLRAVPQPVPPSSYLTMSPVLFFNQCHYPICVSHPITQLVFLALLPDLHSQQCSLCQYPIHVSGVTARSLLSLSYLTFDPCAIVQFVPPHNSLSNVLHVIAQSVIPASFLYQCTQCHCLVWILIPVTRPVSVPDMQLCPSFSSVLGDIVWSSPPPSFSTSVLHHCLICIPYNVTPPVFSISLPDLHPRIISRTVSPVSLPNLHSLTSLKRCI